MRCAVCDSRSLTEWADFGPTPHANHLRAGQHDPVPTAPLSAVRCDDCGHAQLGYWVPPEQLYMDYRYDTGVGQTFRDHLIELFTAWTPKTRATLRVLDIGGNDGTALAAAAHAWDVAPEHCVSVDPSARHGQLVAARGMDAVVSVWPPPKLDQTVALGLAPALVQEQYHGILTLNTLNAIRDLHGAVEQIATVLDPFGCWIVEVPHLGPLIRDGLFDTIYHEHVHYWTLAALERLLEPHGLVVVDVHAYPAIHGGTMAVQIVHADARRRYETAVSAYHLRDWRWQERQGYARDPRAFATFMDRVRQHQHAFWRHFVAQSGTRWCAYGAAAKGAMQAHVFHLAGDSSFGSVMDDTEAKDGLWTPYGRLVQRPKTIRADHVLIFPWNVAPEITTRLRRDLHYEGVIVTALPALHVTDAAVAA